MKYFPDPRLPTKFHQTGPGPTLAPPAAEFSTSLRELLPLALRGLRLFCRAVRPGRHRTGTAQRCCCCDALCVCAFTLGKNSRSTHVLCSRLLQARRLLDKLVDNACRRAVSLAADERRAWPPTVARMLDRWRGR